MNKNLFSKTLVLGIVVLLVFTSLPLVSGVGLNSISKEIRISEEDKLSNSEGMHDNILITAEGAIIFQSIINFILTGEKPHLQISIYVTNYNDFSVNIEDKFKIVATQGNRVLQESSPRVFYCEPGSGFITAASPFREKDYTFGSFYVIVEVHVQETNSDIKVVFHGYVFGFGTIIFNLWGKLIE